MMNLFDNIEFTSEEDDALTEAATNTPLDDPDDEAAVQEAKAKLAAEQRGKPKRQQKQKPAHEDTDE